MIEAYRQAAFVLRGSIAARFSLLWLRDTRDPGGPHYGSVADVLKAGGEAGDDLAYDALEGDGWAADARGRWAGDLRREASALVTTATEAARLVLEVPDPVEEERPAWFPEGVSGVTVQRPGAEIEPVAGEHPDGPALALDLAGIKALEELAAGLGEADTAGAETLREEARARWVAFLKDPDGPAADPVADAMDRYAPMLKVDRLTNRAALWRWWVREEKPNGANGNVEVVAGDSIATHKAELGPWRFYQLDPDRERVFIAEVLTPPFLRRLAWVLWHGRWRAEAERLKSAHETLDLNPAALAIVVHSKVGDALQRARPTSDGRLIGADGDQLPLIPTATMEDLEALKVLGTLTGHRTIRWLIYAGNVGHRLGERGPVELASGVMARRAAVGVSLEVEGGFAALAAALGETGSGGAKRVADTVRFLSSYALEWEGLDRVGGGSLISWEQRRGASDGQRRELVLQLSPVLLPMLVHRLEPNDRSLVPVLPLPPIPSRMFRGRGVAPAVARLDWLATRELVDRRGEVASHGGAMMPWDGLAREAGLKNPKHLAHALELWTQDSDHGPARWERVDRHRWNLADRDESRPARDFILEGAKDSARAAEAGRRSARKRQQRKRGGGSKT